MRQGRDDVTDEQEMKGAIEQRERRPFSRASQRRTFRDLVSALDVRGRERSQRPRDLGQLSMSVIL